MADGWQALAEERVRPAAFYMLLTHRLWSRGASVVADKAAWCACWRALLSMSQQHGHTTPQHEACHMLLLPG